MNPEFKKEELKQFKKLVEIQLRITNVVLNEHKKQKFEVECDCDIQNLEKVKEIQQRKIYLCNTTLGLRKEAGRL